MSGSRSAAIPAVVLSCDGAHEGALNVVRSLGELGVPIVVIADHANPAAAASRHCSEFIHLPDFTAVPQRLGEVLQQLRDKHGTAPVVFPTADPDLKALNSLQSPGGGGLRLALAAPAIVDVLMDKLRFNELAVQAGLPVPRAYAASSLAEVESLADRAEYPLIVKPSHPVAWKHDGIPPEISRAKAILVDSKAELLRICRAVDPYGLNLIVQEYVPGGDEEHYDVHAYIDRSGQALATYSGRKWRIYPPHAGSGCFVESLHVPELEELALGILRKIDYRGLANINFKRSSRSGAFRLLEINPRVSQWNILAARSGVNLPWIAYRDLCGLPPQALPERRTQVFYVNGKKDFKAFQEYRRTREWTLGRYVSSLLRPGMVYQTLSLKDPGPALRLTGLWLAAKFGLR
jgi:D-aspartate ligase